MITISPLTNHVILAVEPEPEKSKLIHVQSAVEGLARFARVQSVGPEVRDVKVGQRVLASLTAGAQIADKVTMVTEEAILGVVQ